MDQACQQGQKDVLLHPRKEICLFSTKLYKVQLEQILVDNTRTVTKVRNKQVNIRQMNRKRHPETGLYTTIVKLKNTLLDTIIFFFLGDKTKK